MIADDHAILRDGLKQLFSHVGDMEVVAEASDGKQVLEVLRNAAVDVVILDISMPTLGGLDLVPRIRGQYPALPILVLSMHNEPQMAMNMIKAGASGYVCKDCEPLELIMAVRRVVSGRRYISNQLAEQLIFLEGGSKVDEPPHQRLSRREQQVLRMLANGKSILEVASVLNISNKTVSTHKTRIMKKMSIESNAKLIRYALTHGLCD
jgi:DNA-binding NarL/FixJ family response regulator